MKKKLYKEVVLKGLTCDEQKDPYLMAKVISTKLVRATDDKIEESKRKFNKNRKCDYYLVYDKYSISYSSIYCGICDKFIALI